MKNPKVLIIPDVHGRTFWKEAVDKYPREQYPDIDIIFLGDYLDPYMKHDGIVAEQAFENFKEILSYAENDPRVILLIGNHDWHYFVNLDVSRMDYERRTEIHRLFVENIDKQMFSIVAQIEINGTTYIFSHAGITKKWLDDITEVAKDILERTSKDSSYKKELALNVWIEALSEVNVTEIFEIFNICLHKYSNTYYSHPFSRMSYYRGGPYNWGSCIWADVREHLNSPDLASPNKKYYQIFGHTYCKRPAISYKNHNWAMLDCAKAFMLDDEGNIEEV